MPPAAAAIRPHLAAPIVALGANNTVSSEEYVMRHPTTLLIGLLAACLILVGCSQPIWLPSNQPYRGYRSVPSSSPLHGYYGPGGYGAPGYGGFRVNTYGGYYGHP